MAKTNLILLHGALGAKSQLKTLEKLLQPSFNVYLFELEGHGERNSSTPFTMTNFAKNLLDFIAEEGIRSTAVFGFSMGGYVALKASLQCPEIIHAVVTLGTKFNWTPEIATKESSFLNPDKIIQKTPAYAEYLKSLHGEPMWRSNLKKTGDLMRDLGNGEGLSEKDFEQISVKVYLGLGEFDKMVTKDETTRIQDLIPNAQFYSLPETPHPIDKVDTQLLRLKIQELLT